MDQVERTARLIRSKGVGVYFVTQAPTDVPSSVLAQLGNRVQHALRAFTPDDADALRKTARTFPTTEFYDVEKTITSLGTGEALVTVLSPKGVPTPLAADPPARSRFADGADRRGPVPGPDRDQPVPGQVRRDRRPRQRPRTDHGATGSGASGRHAGLGRGRDAGRRAADDRDRHEHHDAGPAAARDHAPGEGDGGRPEAQPSASARRRRRPSATPREPSRRRSTTPSGPAARSSPRGSVRTSCAASSGRSSAAASPADRAGVYSMTRSAGRSGAGG